MGIINIWLEETKKYKVIIDLVAHMNFEQNGKRPIAHLYPSLEKLLDECQLTSKGIAREQLPPLCSGRALFESNLSYEQIEQEVNKAHDFFNQNLKLIQKAAEGKVKKQLTYVQRVEVENYFMKSLKAIPAKDFLFVGDEAHLYDDDINLFKRMCEFLARY